MLKFVLKTIQKRLSHIHAHDNTDRMLNKQTKSAQALNTTWG